MFMPCLHELEGALLLGEGTHVNQYTGLSAQHSPKAKHYWDCLFVISVTIMQKYLELSSSADKREFRH